MSSVEPQLLFPLKIKSVFDLIQYEKIRYSKKGSNYIVAILISVFYFICLPPLLYPLYLQLPYTSTFYMIVIGIALVPISSNVIFDFFFMLLYQWKIPYFEQFRASKNQWPWDEDLSEYLLLKKTALKHVFFNNCILTPTALAIQYYFTSIPYQIAPEKFPTIQTFFLQIIFFILIEDTVSYWIHRLLHTSFFYKRIHKVHHSFKNSIAIVTTFQHPLEFILIGMIPTSSGPAILGSSVHLFTLYMWISLKTIESIDGHCGYEFPWSPFRIMPLSAGADYHGFHHSHNQGNFGAFFTIWDFLFGTNEPYLRYFSKKD